MSDPNGGPAGRAERRRRRFAAQCRRIDLVNALDDNAVGYLPRPLVQAHLPLRRVAGPVFSRRSGRLQLHLLAPPGVGLPYGRYPRLFLAWMGTQAVRRRDAEIPLGASLSAFLRGLSIGVSGGRYGPIHRFRDQVRRLLATTITTVWEGDRSFETESFAVARRSYLWWDRPQEVAAGGVVRLSLDFYDELVATPVPVDLRALAALTSPLAMDLYGWLTYRRFSLRRPVLVPWVGLYEQFGTQTKRVRDFRRRFRTALQRVLHVYPAVRVTLSADGLLLTPGKPHIMQS